MRPPSQKNTCLLLYSVGNVSLAVNLALQFRWWLKIHILTLGLQHILGYMSWWDLCAVLYGLVCPISVRVCMFKSSLFNWTWWYMFVPHLLRRVRQVDCLSLGVQPEQYSGLSHVLKTNTCMLLEFRTIRTCWRLCSHAGFYMLIFKCQICSAASLGLASFPLWGHNYCIKTDLNRCIWKETWEMK